MMSLVPAIYIFCILLPSTILAACGRWHGAGFKDELTGNHTGWPKYGRQISTVVFVLAAAAANYSALGVWWLAPFFGGLSGFGLATGHGRFYAMNGANLADPKPETIERLGAIWFWEKVLRRRIDEPAYSLFCMAIKGIIIGVAAWPLGLLLAIVYPAAYWFSFKVKFDSAPAEWITGGFSGLFYGITIAWEIASWVNL